MSKVDPKYEAENFLKKKNIRGAKILFSMVAGSRAYNISTENSDYDYIAIYQIPTENIISLDALRQPTTITHDREEKPDIVLYEIGRYIELLCKGNPRTLQCLFADRLCYQSSEWHRLQSMRRKFLTRRTVYAYLGHIESEKKHAMASKKYGFGKPLYHAFRLTFELERILDGRDPWVWFPAGEEQREFLLSVRREEQSRNEYLTLLEEHLKPIREQKPWSQLAEDVPLVSEKETGDGGDGEELENGSAEEGINDWLISLRRQGFQS
eukprot:gb/GECH01014754.1/.p1 GENE.gb/GECH01014754.1/~~gb/GECH01014754.1/.p1  ORF type:complete len:267 (+),score=55.56 gb/GECH01014754.1/:1-801(+)